MKAEDVASAAPDFDGMGTLAVTGQPTNRVACLSQVCRGGAALQALQYFGNLGYRRGRQAASVSLGELPSGTVAPWVDAHGTLLPR